VEDKTTSKKSAPKSGKTPRRQPKTLVEFFRRSPLRGAKLDLKRLADYGRDIRL